MEAASGALRLLLPASSPHGCPVGSWEGVLADQGWRTENTLKMPRATHSRLLAATEHLMAKARGEEEASVPQARAMAKLETGCVVNRQRRSELWRNGTASFQLCQMIRSR